MAEKINVRGLLFDNVTKAEAVELIASRLEAGVTTVVITPNAEIVQSCVENEEMFRIVSSADVLLADGIGIIKAARILGTPIKEKVAGVEMGEALFERLRKHRFFLFGGKEGTAESAASKMAEKYGTDFAGCRHGYFAKTGKENDETVEAINKSGADVLYVCLGSPVQEKWIWDNAERLENVKLILALGGSLDIYAGNAKRAPKFFIKTGTEWLWRLICQPSRFVRMTALPKFYFGTWIYKLKKK